MENQNQNQEIITWQAPEFRYYDKSPLWYVSFFALTVAAVGFFVIQKDYFGAVCMAILAALIYFFSRQQPETVDISIDQKGVLYGKIRFPYAQIKHFYVLRNQQHQSINIETTALLNNSLILELGDIDPEPIRDFLLQFIPEHDEPKATMAQRFSGRFKI